MDATIKRYSFVLYTVVGLTLLVSILIAMVIAGRFKRAIFGLEPEEIARLFQERDATLQSVREGIIAINRDGVITTFNRTALETLGIAPETPLSGRPILDILPESDLLSVLESGTPDFDREVWLTKPTDDREPLARAPGRRTLSVLWPASGCGTRWIRSAGSLPAYNNTPTRLRSQTHEYSNKLHTIAGLIQIEAYDDALNLIGSEVSDHQALIHLLLDAVPDPVIAGCLSWANTTAPGRWGWACK